MLLMRNSLVPKIEGDDGQGPGSGRKYQQLDYMHKNPVTKKWQLVNDFTDYLYSSAPYYEKGIKQYDKLLHVNEVLL